MTRESGTGGAQPEVTPPEKSKGVCRVNGVLSYALLDTGAEATIISNGIYHRINAHTSKLEPHESLFLGPITCRLMLLVKHS